MKKFIVLTTLLLTILILSGCGNKNNDQFQVDPSVKGTQSQKIPFDIVKSGYSKGPADAKVTIVEFSDYQCPACKQMYKVADSVVAAYPNDVRLVYRNFPLDYHQNSTKAAYAAEAAGKQAKFWEMHNLLFDNQDKLSDTVYSDFAKQLGLNLDQFNNDRGSQEIYDKVQADLDQGQTLNLGGTPTFYINNVEYTGQYSLAGFKAEIDKILAGQK